MQHITQGPKNLQPYIPAVTCIIVPTSSAPRKLLVKNKCSEATVSYFAKGSRPEAARIAMTLHYSDALLPKVNNSRSVCCFLRDILDA